ncbi:mitogen-activated protein kinase kinase kinase YODA-like [Nymphaea colorata]|nr:mitogen-activated protein kinase kinase kinase YODA-like [Nymphaea colorata]
MPSWWGKSSSKEAKKKTGKDNIFENFHFRKLKILSEEKGSFRSKAGFRRQSIDTISEKGSASRAESRSTSPSNQVSRCQSFADRLHSQVLPLPGVQHSHTDLRKPAVGAHQSKLSKHEKPSSFLPLPAPEKASSKPDTTDADCGLGTGTASVSSECSIDSDDPTEPRQIVGYGHHSPKGNGHSNKSVASSRSSVMRPASSPIVGQKNSRQTLKPANLPQFSQVSHTSKRRGPLSTIEHPPSLQIPQYHAFGSGPDSSMSSPSRSPLQVFSSEQQNGCFWAPKAYPETLPFGSGHCSSPGSGHNSGHNSVGGDLSGQLFWQPSRGSPEYSPIPSPRMASPGPSSRIHSGAVTPLHPRAGGAGPESPTSWQDEGKQQQCHKLPLPPLIISNANPFCSSNALTTTSSSLPRSPGKAENPPSPGLRWKKGKLLGRGTFGHVYVGFSNESGDMCAMKEVTLFADDAKSKECARQLGQEIALLSRLRHQNIVQYYGSETIDDKLYIYLEYVSGGSIHKLLQEYGAFSEPVIRSYTQQILSGLAYLHAKNTVHRDIKGANILVDPNGRVKLADFGMAKHVTGHSLALSFKGSPYWMAPEVIKNSNGCNLAVDIWSLGCTVLEMATRKPPWSQYEGVAALFKIGNSKELPAIPDSLSDEGKHFVKLCLQRNPSDRPTAAQLLEHPFVKNAAPLARPDLSGKPCELNNNVTSIIRQAGVGHARHLSSLDMEAMAIQKDRVVKSFQLSSDNHMPPFMSLPVSPTGSPHLHSRSPHHVSGRMSPASISSPLTMSGSSTPLTGGNGAIPFHLKYSSIHSESYGGIRSPVGLYLNSSTIGTYHDLKPDFFFGAQECPSVLQEKRATENNIRGKAFSRPTYGENQLQYGGRVALGEHVSQLLRNPANTNLSPDVRPSSPMLGHPRQFVKS